MNQRENSCQAEDFNKIIFCTNTSHGSVNNQNENHTT